MDAGMWGEIKIGDHVRPRSGGPEMIVEAMDDDGHVRCYWQDGQRRVARFRPDQLERFSKDDTPQPHEPAI